MSLFCQLTLAPAARRSSIGSTALLSAPSRTASQSSCPPSPPRGKPTAAECTDGRQQQPSSSPTDSSRRTVEPLGGPIIVHTHAHTHTHCCCCCCCCCGSPWAAGEISSGGGPAATARPPCPLTCLGHVGSGPEPAMHQNSALETRTCRVSVCLELLASAFQPLDLLPGPSEHSRSSESASAWNLPQRAVRRRLGPHRALLQCIFGSVVGTINLRVPCAAAGAALLVCFGPPAAATLPRGARRHGFICFYTRRLIMAKI
jgi:hypothetical protein